MQFKQNMANLARTRTTAVVLCVMKQTVRLALESLSSLSVETVLFLQSNNSAIYRRGAAVLLLGNSVETCCVRRLLTVLAAVVVATYSLMFC